MGPVSTDVFSSEIKLKKKNQNEQLAHRPPWLFCSLKPWFRWHGSHTGLSLAPLRVAFCLWGLSFVIYKTFTFLLTLRAASSVRPLMWELCEEMKASSHKGILASRLLFSSSLLIIIHNAICKMELL